MNLSDNIIAICTSVFIIFVICYMYRYRLAKGFNNNIDGIRVKTGFFNRWLSGGNSFNYYTI
jgi:hypothetical protein